MPLVKDSRPKVCTVIGFGGFCPAVAGNSALAKLSEGGSLRPGVLWKLGQTTKINFRAEDTVGPETAELRQTRVERRRT